MAANGHELLELYHAAFLGGGIINPLNLRLAPKRAAGHPRRLRLPRSSSSTRSSPAISCAASSPSARSCPLRAVVLIGSTATTPTTSATRSSSSSASRRLPPEPEEDDPVVLMYTGGNHRAPQRGPAGPSRRAAEPLPHRHDRRPRPRPRLPPPDADVPRGIDGRDPRYPGDRRHIGLPAPVRAGGRHGPHCELRGRLDRDGPDDDLHAASIMPSSVPRSWHRFATSSTARPRCRRLCVERIQATPARRRSSGKATG